MAQMRASVPSGTISVSKDREQVSMHSTRKKYFYKALENNEKTICKEQNVDFIQGILILAF